MSCSEKWKRISGKFGFGYEISDYGNIRSRRTLGGIHGIKRDGSFRKINPGLAGNGYFTVVLYDRNKNKKTFCIHHLVAKEFIGEKPPGCEIDHINRIKTDNRVSNLRYVSRAINVRNGGGRTKLSIKDVIEIRKRNSNGESQRSLAREFGVDSKTVNYLVRFITWK